MNYDDTNVTCEPLNLHTDIVLHTNSFVQIPLMIRLPFSLGLITFEQIFQRRLCVPQAKISTLAENEVFFVLL